MDESHVDRKIARSRFLRLSRAFPLVQDPVSAEVRRRHIEGLECVSVPPGRVLDAGSGNSAPLPSSLAKDGCVRLDWVGWGRDNGPDVIADLASLPFADSSFSLVWANLSLPWVGDLPGAMAEARRVLSDGGLLSLATFGPDTLTELRSSLESGTPRAMGFLDMHDLADMAMHAGFAEPVAVCERITLEYSSSRAMLEELRGFGALAATGMSTALGAGNDLPRLMEAAGPASLTFEVTYVHAWALAQRVPRGPAGWQEVLFSRRPAGGLES